MGPGCALPDAPGTATCSRPPPFMVGRRPQHGQHPKMFAELCCSPSKAEFPGPSAGPAAGDAADHTPQGCPAKVRRSGWMAPGTFWLLLMTLSLSLCFSHFLSTLTGNMSPASQAADRSGAHQGSVPQLRPLQPRGPRLDREDAARDRWACPLLIRTALPAGSGTRGHPADRHPPCGFNPVPEGPTSFSCL